MLKDFFTTYNEFTKYLIRFAVVAFLAIPILWITQGINALKVMGYKVALAAVAVGLAEVIWAFFFKPVFGKTENYINKQPPASSPQLCEGSLNESVLLVGKLEGTSDVQSIMLFRGILYAAIILALCLGL